MYVYNQSDGSSTSTSSISQPIVWIDMGDMFQWEEEIYNVEKVDHRHGKPACCIFSENIDNDYNEQNAIKKSLVHIQAR